MTRRIGLIVVIFAAAASGVWAIDRLRLRPPQRAATHLVSGKLLVNGVPAANATIAFHPLGSHAAEIYRPVGTTRKDGAFNLMTFVVGDGAPAGEYVVTVLMIDPTQPYDECGDMKIHDVLQGRYLDPATSTLRAEVKPESNALVLHATLPGSWSSSPQRIAHPKK